LKHPGFKCVDQLSKYFLINMHVLKGMNLNLAILVGNNIQETFITEKINIQIDHVNLIPFRIANVFLKNLIKCAQQLQ